MPTPAQTRQLHQQLDSFAEKAFLPATNATTARIAARYLEVCRDWLDDTPPLPVTHRKLSALAALHARDSTSASSLDSLVYHVKKWARGHCHAEFLPSPTDALCWRTAKRALEKQQVQQAAPKTTKLALRLQDLELLYHTLDLSTLADCQLWCAVVLSHQACLRGSDTVGVRLLARTVTFTPHGATVVLHKHKSSDTPTNLGFATRHDNFCVPTLLQHYFRMTGLQEAALQVPEALLFPAFAPDGTLTAATAVTPRWSRAAWVATLRSRMGAVQLRGSERLGLHCLRRGGATDYLDAGVAIESVQQLGRWASKETIQKFYDDREPAAASAAVLALARNTGTTHATSRLARR